jgi:hypothetical protein
MERRYAQKTYTSIILDRLDYCTSNRPGTRRRQDILYKIAFVSRKRLEVGGSLGNVDGMRDM